MVQEMIVQGVIPPIPTPYRDKKYDPVSHERVYKHLVAQGANGILVFGLTGEAPYVDIDDKMEACQRLARIKRDSTRLFVNVTEGTPQKTFEFAEFAMRHGVDGVVYAPMFHEDRDPLVLIKSGIDNVPMPWVLYVNSHYTHGKNLRPSVVREVLSEPKYAKWLAGVKVSTGSIEDFLEIRDDAPSFGVAQGDEKALMENPRLEINAIVPSSGVHDYQRLRMVYQCIVDGQYDRLEAYFEILRKCHAADDQAGGTISSLKSRLTKIDFEGVQIFLSPELAPKNPLRINQA